MLKIKRILENDRLLRATTGLNRKAFAQLLQDFEPVYQAQREQDSETRIRKMGGGSKGKLKTIK